MKTGRPDYSLCRNEVRFDIDRRCPMCGGKLRVIVYHESREDFRYRVSWHHRATMHCIPCGILAELDVPGPAGHWDYVLRTEKDRDEAARKLFSRFCERWADKVRPKDNVS